MHGARKQSKYCFVCPCVPRANNPQLDPFEATNVRPAVIHKIDESERTVPRSEQKAHISFN